VLAEKLNLGFLAYAYDRILACVKSKNANRKIIQHYDHGSATSRTLVGSEQSARFVSKTVNAPPVHLALGYAPACRNRSQKLPDESMDTSSVMSSFAR
jgi:hypothetical protein